MSVLLKKLKDKFLEIVPGSFQTVRVGYIQDLASGQTDYDALLIIPPSDFVPKYRTFERTQFTLKYYLIRLDQGASGGEMTEDERITAWDELWQINKEMILAIMETPNEMHLVDDGLTVNRDSGGEDGLLPDKVIWIEVALKIEMDVC